MPLVYPNMQLSEVVEEHPSLIPVINRFGIRLGLGDKSVKTLCEEHSLDMDFLLTVINTFLNEEYFPEKKLQTFHTSQIIDYLTKTNQYYLRYQLPNIERHLGSFISMSTPGNPTLGLIGRFFSSFKEELIARIEKDDKIWFPYCMSLSKKLGKEPAGTIDGLQITSEQRTEDTIEALLADLKVSWSSIFREITTRIYVMPSSSPSVVWRKISNNTTGSGIESLPPWSRPWKNYVSNDLKCIETNK